MAGGIDWFRWHHGTVTDQKFPLIAKRASATVAEVIAVWACLLEQASMNAEQRGCLGEPDFESMDYALGLDDGKSMRIFSAFQAKALIDAAGALTAWPARQPKREREDDNSTERVKAFRSRKRHETPSNASDSQETPRGEESREEEKDSGTNVPDGAAVSPAPPPSPGPEEIIFSYGVALLVNAGSSDKQARSFLGGLRKHHQDEAIVEALRQCIKAKALQPVEYLAAALPPKGAPPRSRQSNLEANNARVAREFLAEQRNAPE